MQPRIFYRRDSMCRFKLLFSVDALGNAYMMDLNPFDNPKVVKLSSCHYSKIEDSLFKESDVLNDFQLEENFLNTKAIQGFPEEELLNNIKNLQESKKILQELKKMYSENLFFD